jgi:hypothetical protein
VKNREFKPNPPHYLQEADFAQFSLVLSVFWLKKPQHILVWNDKFDYVVVGVMEQSYT